MCIKTGRIKIRVTPEQSKKIQEICFKNNISWFWSAGEDIAQYIYKPFLFIDDSISFMEELDKGRFIEHPYEEISAEFFIKTNGTCFESESTTESNPSEEMQPKTLSQYLKENNAYESFVENCVEYFLENTLNYKDFSLYNREIRIGNIFYWRDTEQGSDYWFELNEHRPINLVYDLNETIFAEVDKRIAEQEHQSEPEFITDEEFKELLEQKATKKYMVFIEGKENSNKIYTDIQKAEVEAKRLSTKEIGLKVFLVEIVKEYKSEVVLNELPK